MLGLVCIDVDGTLVGASGRIQPDVRAAVDQARAAGVRLALCSGRPAFGITRSFAELLDPAGWHVFQNGASVLNLPTGASRSRALPPAAVQRLVARARETGRILELYTDVAYAVETDAPRARRHAELLGVPFVTSALDRLEGTPVRAQWLAAREDEAVVLAEPDEGLARVPSLAPSMPDTVFVNFTPAGVSKATGVRAVAEAYGVPLARVMMVGDGNNDLEAMRAVGFPVAMRNAEPEVLATCRHVVGDVDTGGLVEALALALRA